MNSQLTIRPTSFCDYLARRGYQVIRFDNRDEGLTTKLAPAGLLPLKLGLCAAVGERWP